MHDLFTWPRAMAEYLAQIPEIQPIFVDNASSYPPLLEYYEACPFEVIRCAENLGHRVVWVDPAMFESRTDDLYIVTDPDLDLSHVPTDLLVRLEAGLRAHDHVSKAGLSIEIQGIPLDFPKHDQVLEWETPFWNNPIGDRWYDAPIDTTFAMYSRKKGWPGGFMGAVRAARPYTVRHLPFYLTPANMTDEYRYYMEHASEVSSSSQYLKGLL